MFAYVCFLFLFLRESIHIKVSHINMSIDQVNTRIRIYQEAASCPLVFGLDHQRGQSRTPVTDRRCVQLAKSELAVKWFGLLFFYAFPPTQSALKWRSDDFAERDMTCWCWGVELKSRGKGTERKSGLSGLVWWDVSQVAATYTSEVSCKMRIVYSHTISVLN